MVITNNAHSSYFYRIGGTLDADELSYVSREGDKELYKGLKKGDFCYVLNSRQMGKSSLAIRVQDQLESEDIITAYIDLQDIGRTDEAKWYNGIIMELADELSEYLSVDWTGLSKHDTSLSPIQKLNQFLDKVVLASDIVQEAKLVIFIDEIDYVKNLPFPTDSFFTLIRSCYNSRARKPSYKALSFCLLGVATPSDLIDEKHITPFNIGEAIALKGFTIEEVKPLIRGLENRIKNPKETMKEILYWTGGQPFLTQRVCDLVVNQGSRTPNLTELVQRNIIDNWDDPDQDKQEHLRTIRNRLLSNEQRAGLLLELYREVLTKGKLTVNNTREERELTLSGLVIKRGGILEVYNPIYAHVFNESWIDTELGKLRPYSESYRAWIQSGKSDASRLLRGQALEEAEKWASGKNLGGEDRDFLSASRASERAEEIERKDKEAAEKRNQILEEANQEVNSKLQKANLDVEEASLKVQKANQELIQTKKVARRQKIIGSSILGITLLFASVLGAWAWQAKQERDMIKANIKVADQLSKQAGILQQNNYPEPAKEALVQAGLSLRLEDPEVKQALSWSGISLTYQYLGQRPLETEDKKPPSQIKYSSEQIEHWKEAEKAIIESLNLLEKEKDLTSFQVLPVAFFTYSVLGNLLEEAEFATQELNQDLITGNVPSGTPSTSQEAYQKAISLIERNPNLSADSPSLSQDNVDRIYLTIWDSLEPKGTKKKEEESLRQTRDNLRNLIQASLKKHYAYLVNKQVQELEEILKDKNWKEADQLTWKTIVNLSYSQEINIFRYSNVSCEALRQMDLLWLSESEGKFGFSPQLKAYKETGNPIGYYNEETYRAYGDQVGWRKNGKWLKYKDLSWNTKASNRANVPYGHLPGGGQLVYVVALERGEWRGGRFGGASSLSLRLENCSATR